MPAYKNRLTESEIWQIISWMRAGFPPADYMSHTPHGGMQALPATRRHGAGWRRERASDFNPQPVARRGPSGDARCVQSEACQSSEALAEAAE
jgi:hypothetical protein